MAKFCTSCGNELHEDAVICPKCGISQETKPQVSKSNTNGLAIAGFVCSFFFALVGLILSIVGLNKSKQTNSGRGLAIAGIIISSVSMAFALLIVIFTFYLIGTGVDYYKDNIYDVIEETVDKSTESKVVLEGTAGFNEITYSEYMEKINSNEPFLVVIIKEGCTYCEMYEPIVTEVAEEYNIPIYYINVTNLTEDEFDELTATNSYLNENDWGTPTTLFMYGDTVVDAISGYVEKDMVVYFIKEYFNV